VQLLEVRPEGLRERVVLALQQQWGLAPHTDRKLAGLGILERTGEPLAPGGTDVEVRRVLLDLLALLGVDPEAELGVHP
jgi:hypothetical protein